MFGSPWLHAEVEKVYRLYKEEVCDKDCRKIGKVQKTRRYSQHLHSLSKRTKPKKVVCKNKKLFVKSIVQGQTGTGKAQKDNNMGYV